MLPGRRSRPFAARAVPSAVASLALAAALSAGGAARAGDERQVCYDAYEHAQVKKKEGDPRKARDLSRLCARDVCPTFVRADCVTWMDEAEKAVPTIVLQAQTDAGDATEARVLVDDAEVTTRLDGRSIEVDPGSHRVRFQIGNQEREVRVVIKEGEKSRSVVADFRSPRSDAAASTKRLRPVPTLVWVTAGVGVAGLATFGALAVAGTVEKSSLQTKCAPFCTDAQTSTARALFLGADIALGVGLVSAAAATTLYLLRPEVEAPPAAPPPPAVSVSPLLTPTTQGAVLRGVF